MPTRKTTSAAADACRLNDPSLRATKPCRRANATRGTGEVEAAELVPSPQQSLKRADKLRPVRACAGRARARAQTGPTVEKGEPRAVSCAPDADLWPVSLCDRSPLCDGYSRHKHDKDGERLASRATPVLASGSGSRGPLVRNVGDSSARRATQVSARLQSSQVCSKRISPASGLRHTRALGAAANTLHCDLERDGRANEAIQRLARVVRACLQAFERRVRVELVHLREGDARSESTREAGAHR